MREPFVAEAEPEPEVETAGERLLPPLLLLLLWPPLGVPPGVPAGVPAGEVEDKVEREAGNWFVEAAVVKPEARS